MSESMSIGTLARRSGVPAKTIRYYESVGLLPAPARAANGYRVYSAAALMSLGFVARARAAGFPIEDVRGLLSLWRDPERASAEVKAIAQRRLADIEHQQVELQALRETLSALVERCPCDSEPHCPNLDDLSERKLRPQ